MSQPPKFDGEAYAKKWGLTSLTGAPVGKEQKTKPPTPPYRPPPEEKFSLKFAREEDLDVDFDFTTILEPKPRVVHNVRPLNSMKPSLPDFSLPDRFQNPTVFEDTFGAKKQNPMYRTTNHNLGFYRPSKHEMPLVYFGQKASFLKETRN